MASARSTSRIPSWLPSAPITRIGLMRIWRLTRTRFVVSCMGGDPQHGETKSGPHDRSPQCERPPTELPRQGAPVEPAIGDACSTSARRACRRGPEGGGGDEAAPLDVL